MGLFGSSSPFDVDIEKATNENNTTDQWGLIMEICDRVGASPINAKECLRSIMKRLAHNDPHVVIQAITLLDACVSNCGKTFHLEVASREFETEVRRLLTKQQPAVAKKLAGLIKKWAENDFKGDPQLDLIAGLYSKLVQEKHEFAEMSGKETATAKAQPLSKDPNVVSSQQEMEDIAKAIELSLKESPMKHATATTSSGSSAATSSKSSSVPTSLYPTTSLSGNNFMGAAASTTTSSVSQARKVRALYDFEAAEDNELNFIAGDIIHVTDDSDPNWWKGYNQRGEGLFPASFVTADLSVEPESMRFDLNKKTSKKSVQFVDDLKQEEEDKEEAIVTVNEEQLDRLLHLLHEANPEDPSTDTDEMLKLENMVNQMGPLIDTELERVDRTHAQLTRLSVGLVDAFNLYHTLMRESEKPHYGYNNPQPGYGGHMHGMPGQYTMGGPQSMPNMSYPSTMYNQQPQSGMTYNMAPVQHSYASNGMMMGGPPPQSSSSMVDPVSSSTHSQMNPAGMHPQQMGHIHHQQQQQQHQPPPHQQSHPAVSGIVMAGGGPHPQSPIMTHHQNGQPHPQNQQQQQLSHVANTTTSNSIGGVPITNPGYLPPPQSHEDPALAAMNYHHQVQLPGGGPPATGQQQVNQIHGMQQQFNNSGPQPTQFNQSGDGSSPHHAPLNHHPSQQPPPNGPGQIMVHQQQQPQMSANYNHAMFSGGGAMNMPVVAAGMPMGGDMNPMYQQR